MTRWKAAPLLLLALSSVEAQIQLNFVPSRALGHPNLRPSTSVPNLVEGREFSSPQSVAVDANAATPHLYVSDASNNRVLAWRDARSFSNGQKADLVLGQRDFLSTFRGGPRTATSTGLFLPSAVAVDPQGDLWILDSGNNRILRFPRPFDQSEQLPDLVVGQTSFSCATCDLPNAGGLSARTIAVGGNQAFGAAFAFDRDGNLWFLDTGNHRVLRYPADVLTRDARNGPAADLVLGQVDFLSATPATEVRDRVALRFPTGLALDPAGRLYVADSLNRILVWEVPASSGQPANRIVGVFEPPAGQTAPAANDQIFNGPEGLFFVGGSLGVADTRNHRLVFFDPYEQWLPESTLFSPRARAAGPVGQNDYTQNKANRDLPQPDAHTLNSPSHAALLGDELFVVDSLNHRVLVFPAAGLGSASRATRVLGQDAFDRNSRNLIEGREFSFQGVTTAGNVFDGGLVVDWNSDPPHLYVADSYNHRVLGFRDVRRVRPGDAADLVIGQPSLFHALINYPTNDPEQPSAQSLFLPTGLLLDDEGNLYVADTGNGRVLRFPKPFAGGSFPRANLVLGQGNFTTRITDPTPSRMRSPYGLAFAGRNALLVSDASHNRVLLFRGAPEELTNGQSAALVFGQPNFNSFGAGSGDNQMNGPRHIATDSDDRLYVADTGNNRILIFNRAPSAGTDPRAATILTTVAGASRLSGPRGVYVNPVTGEIWVAEIGLTRVSRYPRFDDLVANQFAANLQLPTEGGSVALTQDRFGNLLYAETTNRVAIHFPSASVINAANQIPGRALAPGTIASLFGQGGVISEELVTGPGNPVSREVAGIQVLVNDRPAPIFAVAGNQVNFVIPQDTPSNGTVPVEVVRTSTGQVVCAGVVSMAAVSPGLFTSAASGDGQVAAINEDGSINSEQAPVGRGKVISLFGTGFGVVPGSPPDGEAPTGPVSTPLRPRVWINNWVPDENILYSGLAPGLVGVWQINVRIPQTVPPNNAILTFIQVDSVNSITQGQRTTIAVKQE